MEKTTKVEIAVGDRVFPVEACISSNPTRFLQCSSRSYTPKPIWGCTAFRVCEASGMILPKKDHAEYSQSTFFGDLPHRGPNKVLARRVRP